MWGHAHPEWACLLVLCERENAAFEECGATYACIALENLIPEGGGGGIVVCLSFFVMKFPYYPDLAPFCWNGGMRMKTELKTRPLFPSLPHSPVPPFPAPTYPSPRTPLLRPTPTPTQTPIQFPSYFTLFFFFPNALVSGKIFFPGFSDNAVKKSGYVLKGDPSGGGGKRVKRICREYFHFRYFFLFFLGFQNPPPKSFNSFFPQI